MDQTLPPQSKPPKRHHTVPALLLRNFSDDTGRVWVGDKEAARVFQASVRNALVENHKYTTRRFRQPHAPPSNQDFVDMIQQHDPERIISQIESRAAPVIAKILEAVRSGQALHLDDAESYALKQFILTMRRRTREALQRHVPERYSEDLLYDAIKDVLAREGIEYVPDRETFLGGSWRQEYGALILGNADAEYASGRFPAAQEEERQFCRDMGLCVGVITEPGREFVIGSQGTTFGEFLAHGSRESVGLVPVAHDVVIMATRLVQGHVCVLIGPGGQGKLGSGPLKAAGRQDRVVAWLGEDPKRSSTASTVRPPTRVRESSVARKRSSNPFSEK